MRNYIPFGALGEYLAEPKQWKDLPSVWVELRQDLVIRLQMCDHNLFVTTHEGVVVEAFRTKSQIEQKDLLWSDDYMQHSLPDLSKHGLTVEEQEAVHKAAELFAPQLRVWSNDKVK